MWNVHFGGEYLLPPKIHIVTRWNTLIHKVANIGWSLRRQIFSPLQTFKPWRDDSYRACVEWKLGGRYLFTLKDAGAKGSNKWGLHVAWIISNLQSCKLWRFVFNIAVLNGNNIAVLNGNLCDKYCLLPKVQIATGWNHLHFAIVEWPLWGLRVNISQPPKIQIVTGWNN